VEAGDGVLLVEVLLDEVAALAIAAPPPARAAITATVISTLVITLVTSFGGSLGPWSHHGAGMSDVRRMGRRVTWEVIDGAPGGWDRGGMSTQTAPSPSSVSPPAVSPSPTRAGRWAPLPVILTGTFMVVLDFFIVNVALPSMQGRLHASSSSVEWVVAGYGLTTAVLIITGARMGDRWGRRRVFTAGLALFTLSSAACGVAGTPAMLVISRLAQGAAGALLMPNVLSIIGVLYDGADRARALAAYGMVMGLAAVSGQLIGGVLVQADPAGLGWRSCFLINVPVGVLAVVCAPRVIPESRAPQVARLDGTGTALVTLGLTAVVLPLVEGRAHGWPLWTWLSLAGAPVLLGAFAVHQRRLTGRRVPALMPAGMLSAPGLAAGLVAQLLFWCGQASFFLVLSLYLQQGRRLSALHAGLVFTILAIAYLATSLRAPAMTVRHGRRVLATGALVLAAGHVALVVAVGAVGVGGSVLALVPGLVLVGAGMGLGITPLASLIMGSVEAEHAGAVSGVLATMQNIGGALGVAVIGVIFYGALPHGIGHAFQSSVAALAVALAGVAALTRLLPAASPGARMASADPQPARAEVGS
jgi:EmrB/QacA subfamily drug resistance transporter